ncbi:MAG: gamma-glutamyl-gamma-aminobutyrate hydrolase family protein, partial [Bacteroidota bacterium]
EQMEAAGLIASGKNPATGLVEIVELKDHPFFIGVQYHPELKSTVEAPAPLFVSFISAAKEYSEVKHASKGTLVNS